MIYLRTECISRIEIFRIDGIGNWFYHKRNFGFIGNTLSTIIFLYKHRKLQGKGTADILRRT